MLTRSLIAAVAVASGCVSDRSLPSPGDAVLLIDAAATSADLVSTVDWLSTDPGPSHPETFSSFAWQDQVRNCPSSACIDFFDFQASCTMTLQVNDLGRTAVASDADCAAMKRRLTSDAFLTALRSTVPCPEAGQPYEDFQLALTDGTKLARKTWECQVEPYVTVRGCIAQLRQRYFP